MKYFAEIDEDNTVLTVVTIDDSLGKDYLIKTEGGVWVETSVDDSFRNKYASTGFTYDETRDVFIEPTPFPSWVLNEDTCQWESPIPYPEVLEGSDEFYKWDEPTTSWVLITE